MFFTFFKLCKWHRVALSIISVEPGQNTVLLSRKNNWRACLQPTTVEDMQLENVSTLLWETVNDFLSEEEKRKFWSKYSVFALISLKSLEGEKNALKFFFEILEKCLNKMGFSRKMFICNWNLLDSWKHLSSILLVF